jgi:hypothetical protein
MILPVLTWMKTKFGQTDPATQEPDDAHINTILKSKRLLNPDKAEAWLANDDDDASVDSDTAQVTVTLHDLDGSKTIYGHDYIYVLSNSMFKVEVNGVVIAGSAYTYDTMAMELEFTAARPEATPVVTVTGHLLNLRAAMREYGRSIILALSTLASVRDGEFERLSARIERTVNAQYGARIIQR